MRRYFRESSRNFLLKTNFSINMKEGQNLYNLVINQNYSSELRNILAQFGLRRIGNNQWVSKETAAKYELLFADESDPKLVTGVDLIEKDQHIHINDPKEVLVDVDIPTSSVVTVHHKTAMAMQRQDEITDYYFYLMDQWNEQIYYQTPLGRQLEAIAHSQQIRMDNFLFLPNPLATGGYIFGAIREGKAASMHSWLDLPDGRFIVPTEGTDQSAFESLQCGLEFHAWEFQNFDTPAAAGQFAIKMLNASKTTYAQSIRKMLGKENTPISRNDFYRNSSGEMCRIEVICTEQGMRFNEVPVVPLVADCIDSLLAPYIKKIALESQR